MYCKNCGHEMVSNFCPNCGMIDKGEQGNEPQQNSYPNPSGYGYQQYDESGFFSENKLGRINGMSANVSLGDWLKFYCLGLLNLIPILGNIAYIVIFFIIGFGSKSAKSMKTYVQASLIFCGIIMAIYIVLLIIFIPILMSMRSSLY